MSMMAIDDSTYEERINTEKHLTVTHDNRKNIYSISHCFSNDISHAILTFDYLTNSKRRISKQLRYETNIAFRKIPDKTASVELIGIGYGSITILNSYRDLNEYQQVRIKRIRLVNSIAHSDEYASFSSKVTFHTESPAIYTTFPKYWHQISEFSQTAIEMIGESDAPRKAPPDAPRKAPPDAPRKAPPDAPRKARLDERSGDEILTFLHGPGDLLFGFTERPPLLNHIKRIDELCADMLTVYHDETNRSYYVVHHYNELIHETKHTAAYLLDYQPNANRALENNTARTIRTIHEQMPPNTSVVLLGVGYGANTTLQSYTLLDPFYRRFIHRIVLVEPLSCALPKDEKLSVVRCDDVTPRTMVYAMLALWCEVMHSIAEAKPIQLEPAFVQNTDDQHYVEVVDLFHNKVIAKLDKFLTHINKGEYDQIKAFNMTHQNDIIQLVQEVEAFAKTKQPSPANTAKVQKYVGFIYNITNNINQVEKLYKDFLREKIAKEGNRKFAEIIHDKDKLIAYFDSIRESSEPLKIDKLTVEPPMMEQKYIEYIKMYGKPDKFFDPVLLAEISNTVM